MKDLKVVLQWVASAIFVVIFGLGVMKFGDIIIGLGDRPIAQVSKSVEELLTPSALAAQALLLPAAQIPLAAPRFGSDARPNAVIYQEHLRQRADVLTPRVRELWERGVLRAAFLESYMEPLRERVKQASAAYRFLSEEQVEAFNAGLEQRNQARLVFRPLSNSLSAPTEDVMPALRQAQASGVFDSLQIGSIEAIADPILVGKIEGVSGYFVIAVWDEDAATRFVEEASHYITWGDGSGNLEFSVVE